MSNDLTKNVTTDTERTRQIDGWVSEETVKQYLGLINQNAVRQLRNCSHLNGLVFAKQGLEFLYDWKSVEKLSSKIDSND